MLKRILHQDEVYLGDACDLDGKDPVYLGEEVVGVGLEVGVVVGEEFDEGIPFFLRDGLNDQPVVVTEEEEAPAGPQGLFGLFYTPAVVD